MLIKTKIKEEKDYNSQRTSIGVQKLFKILTIISNILLILYIILFFK